MTTPERRVFDTPEALADAVADEFLTLVAAPTRTPLDVCLTGGTIADVIHRRIAERAGARDDLDWGSVRFWFGDERFVERDDPDRNSGQARAALLDRLPLRPDQVVEVPAPSEVDDLAGAAAAYSAALREQGSGAFALVMLGIGPDGHVASLFPGQPMLHDRGPAIGVPNSPKPPPERVSLSFEALNRADRVWFLASGDGKADAAARALASSGSVEETPARGVTGTPATRITWFLDAPAASGIPESA